MADGFQGLDFKLMIAGAGGGISIIYALKKPEAWELIAGLVIGAFTANYLTIPISKVFPFSFIPPDYILSIAFCVGIIGKWVCKMILEYGKAKIRVKR
jgi:flagellar biosynthesis protein FliQ